MNVLMFHDVVNDKFPASGFQKEGAKQYCLEESQFVRIITEALKYDRDVELSFDDGGSSFYHVIAPLLEQHGKRGIFFISTSYIGTPQFMTSDEIFELDRRGHIIAAHSHSHPLNISKMSSEEIDYEWKQSKNILEQIVGHNIEVASIPGGAVSKQVINSMISAGYRTIYTSEPTNQPKLINDIVVSGRYTITRNSTPEYIQRILVDNTYKRWLAVRYNILRLGKHILGSYYNKIKQLILKLKR